MDAVISKTAKGAIWHRGMTAKEISSPLYWEKKKQWPPSRPALQNKAGNQLVGHHVTCRFDGIPHKEKAQIIWLKNRPGTINSA